MSTFHSFDEFYMALAQDIEDLKKDLKDNCLRLANEGVDTIKKEANAKDVNYTFEYYNDWDTGKVPNGAKLFNDVPHALNVEYGTPAGTVVVLDDLVKWVEIKLIGRKGMRIDNPRLFAKAIQKNIRNRGTRPRAIWRNTNTILEKRAFEDAFRLQTKKRRVL